MKSRRVTGDRLRVTALHNSAGWMRGVTLTLPDTAHLRRLVALGKVALEEVIPAPQVINLEPLTLTLHPSTPQA